jgi:serine/threonine protein kinase
MSQESHGSFDDLVGRLALTRGLISPEALMEVLSEQAVAMVSNQGVPPRSLSKLLVEKGYLTEYQIATLIQESASSSTAPSSTGGAPAGSVATSLAVSSQTRLGKYVLARELGRGGMGCVFEAYDTELKRKIALKLMYIKPNLDPSEFSPAEERFLREAELTARIPKHPFVVGVYEAGILDGRRYLAMEYIEGLPLSEWREQERVTIWQHVRLLRDVALAVHHAHEHGVIHRDLKPHNVLVRPGDLPCVTDFGLAKAMGSTVNVSLTGSGMTVGTPTYMSPEQAQGLKSLDRRTDIYSLGVMLYEALAGRPPFPGESALEILMKTVKHNLPRPSAVRSGPAPPGLDESIENICMKALARFPKDRQVTAKALADDLSLWLEGEQVNVRLPKANPFIESKRSYRWIFAAVVAGVFGIVLPLAWPHLFPKRPPADALSRAEEWMEQGRYREALLAYTKILAVDPNDSRAVAGQRAALQRMEEDLHRERQAARAAEEAIRRHGEQVARLRRDVETAEAAAEQARREAAAAAMAEAESRNFSKAEMEQIAKQREAAEAQARKAEEASRRIQEELHQVIAKKPTGQLLLPGRERIPAVRLNPAELQPGLVAECYVGAGFQTLAFKRVDPAIDFQWNGKAAWPGGPVDNYSIRWTGYLRVPKTTRYTFEAYSDDGVRLYIDDRLVFSDWTSHSRMRIIGACNLEAGYHRIRLEYYQAVYDACLALLWKQGVVLDAIPIDSEMFFHEPAAHGAPPPSGPPDQRKP